MTDIDPSEQIQQAHRSGATFGISLAEVILIVLFVVLLLLIFSSEGIERAQSDLAAEREKREEAERVIQAVQRSTDKDLESLPMDWNAIVLGYEDNVQQLVEDKQALLDEIAKMEDKYEALKEIAYSTRGGDTTICTYEEATDDADGKASVSLASIWIQDNRIVFLQKAISDPSKIIDFYLSPYDPTPALEIIGRFSTGQIISHSEFESTNQLLDDIGDEYETDTRANCRYTYDYYFDDRISPDRLNTFFRRYLPGQRISEKEVAAILWSNGLTLAKFRGAGGRGRASGSAVEEPKVLKRAKPRMPRRVRKYGDVVLTYYIDITGKATHIEVVSTPSPALGRAAKSALEKFKYEPKKIDGEAVFSDLMTIKFKFEK